jgi:hypothetical protein
MNKFFGFMGKKVLFILAFVVFGLTNSVFADQVRFGDTLRIKNIRTDNYFTAFISMAGNGIFASPQPSAATAFKIVADLNNVDARKGELVKFSDRVYFMYNDSALFIGEFGGEYTLYAGKRRLLGLGLKDQNPSPFYILYASEDVKSIPNAVLYGDVIKLQTKIKNYVPVVYASVNVDISTHSMGREVFFAPYDIRMTPMANKWTKEFVFELVKAAVVQAKPAVLPNPPMPGPGGVRPVPQLPVKNL